MTFYCSRCHEEIQEFTKFYQDTLNRIICKICFLEQEIINAKGKLTRERNKLKRSVTK